MCRGNGINRMAGKPIFYFDRLDLERLGHKLPWNPVAANA